MAEGLLRAQPVSTVRQLLMERSEPAEILVIYVLRTFVYYMYA